MLFFVGQNKKTFNHIMSFMLGTILLGSMSCPIKFCIFISFVFTSYAVLYTCHKLCKGQDFSGTTFSMAVLILSLLFWWVKNTCVRVVFILLWLQWILLSICSTVVGN